MEVEGLPRHDLDATPGDLQLKPDLRTDVLVATADKLWWWTWTDRSLTRSQRSLFASCLVLVNASMACCHVRVVMPLSLPARYALAIWRFRIGWRSAWFFA